MLINTLTESPEIFLVVILAVIYALTVHEFSHAWAATLLGDNTAKFSGRLTLNPLAHMEIFGTIMLVIAGFGWGKPVPVNLYNLKWRRWGGAAVSLAGPLSNFISVFIFIIIFSVIAPSFGPSNLLVIFLSFLIFINLILGVFNLIPIPPLDGSKILFAILPDSFDEFKRKFTINGPFILIALIILDNLANLRILDTIFSFFVNLIERFLI
jgi:Zn-dependent protease